MYILVCVCVCVYAYDCVSAKSETRRLLNTNTDIRVDSGSAYELTLSYRLFICFFILSGFGGDGGLRPGGTVVTLSPF